MGRVAIGKIVGLILGALIFFGSPALGLELSTHFGLGLWLFYIILGALIGLIGIVDHHPIFKFKMPFWLRGAVMGIFMHLMLVLLCYHQMMAVMELDLVQSMGIQSPFWILIDGAILGILIDWTATRHAGDGPLPLN